MQDHGSIQVTMPKNSQFTKRRQRGSGTSSRPCHVCPQHSLGVDHSLVIVSIPCAVRQGQVRHDSPKARRSVDILQIFSEGQGAGYGSNAGPAAAGTRGTAHPQLAHPLKQTAALPRVAGAAATVGDGRKFKTMSCISPTFSRRSSPLIVSIPRAVRQGQVRHDSPKFGTLHGRATERHRLKSRSVHKGQRPWWVSPRRGSTIQNGNGVRMSWHSTGMGTSVTHVRSLAGRSAMASGCHGLGLPWQAACCNNKNTEEAR